MLDSQDVKSPYSIPCCTTLPNESCVCSYNLMGDDTTPGTLLPLSFAACFLLSFLFYCLFFRCFNPATQTAQVRTTALVSIGHCSSQTMHTSPK